MTIDHRDARPGRPSLEPSECADLTWPPTSVGGVDPLAGQWLAHAVLDHLPAVVWIKDLEGRYLGCNREFERYIGASECDIVGRVDTDFVDADTAAVFRRQDRLAMTSDRPVSQEGWVVSAESGRRMLWETTKSLLRDDAGQPVGVMGVAFDITDRDREQETLRSHSATLAEAERVAHIGSWEHDLVTGEVSWSHEMYRIFGVEPGSTPTPDSIRSVVHPEDRDTFDRSASGHRRPRVPSVVEHRIVVGDEIKTVEYRSRDECDDFGGVVRRFGTVQDVTERAREAARAQRFYRLVERAADAVAIIDAETGRIVDCNQKACDEFGGTRHDLLALHVWDLVDDLSDWLWAPVATSVDESTSPLRCDIRRLDGTLVPAEVTMDRFDDGGRDVIVAAARDISDRVERDRVVRESARQYEALLRGANDGFVLTDGAGRILDVNDEYCVQSGYARDELLGRPVLELDEAMTSQDAAARDERLRSLGGEIFETVHRRRDGSTWPVEVSISFSSIDDGRYFVFMRDLSERQLHQRELRRAAERWTALVEGSHDGFIRLDRRGRIVEANQAVCDLVGIERHALLRQSIAVFDQALDDAEVDAVLDRARVERTLRFPTSIGAPGAEPIPVEVSLTFDPSEGGQFFAFVRDVSERERLFAAVERSATKFEAVLGATRDGFLMVDTDGRVLQANDRYLELSGFERDEIVGMRADQLDAIETVGDVGERLQGVEADGAAIFQSWHRRKDGSVWPVEISVSYADVGGGRFLSFVRDMTDRREAERTVLVAAERYRALLGGSTDGFARVALDGTIREVNPRLCHMLGRTEDELVGTSIDDYDVDGDASEFVVDLGRPGAEGAELVAARARRSDGSELPVEIAVSYSPVDGGQIFAFVRDVTERHVAERQIEFLAYHDPLTSLPNRSGFSHLLGDAIDRAQRTGRFVAVCYLDLDGFKPVNDRFGHEIGDAVLVRVAERLRATVRDQDAVARFGGDEFVVLIGDLSSIDQVHDHARLLVEACETPMSIGGRRIHLSASVGITVSPADDGDEDVLLRHADQAMYRAKARGKNTYELFDPVVDSETRRRREELEEFEVALDGDQLVLHYQPRIDLRSGHVVGVEALVRWQHPSRGLLTPGEFLPLIDATPLEIALDEWVLRNALEQLAEWDAAGLELAVSVNISPRHIAKPSFPEYLGTLLRRYPDELARRVELEILETAAVGQVGEVARIMARCSELGVTFSLDDFGTGYSSLTHFSSLPVSVLKIDQGFVRRVMDGARDLDIVEGVVQLAKALGRPVVAEGVETVETGHLLRRLGCQYAQGFGIAKPMPASDVAAWVDGFAEEPSWQEVAIGVERRSDRHDLDVARHVHGQWVAQVLAFTTGSSTAEQPRTSLDRCPLKAWYDGAGSERYGRLASFDAVVRHHEQMHALGADLVHGSIDGAHPSASDLERFSNAAGEFSAAIEALLDDAT